MKTGSKQKLFMSSVVAAVAVGSTATGVSAEIVYKDVNENSPFFPEIQDLKSKGVIEGYTDGTFRPDKQITRAEAAKMIASILKLDLENTKDPVLKDLDKKEWYYQSVAALIENEIMVGYGDGTFLPNQTLTRAEAAKLIGKAFNLENEHTNELPFNDVQKGLWYYEYIQALAQSGVTKGKAADTFAPNEMVTRGELVAFASRAQKAALSKIDKIDATGVTIAGKTYEVAPALQELFASSNGEALKDAQIAFTTKDNKIDKVTALILKNNGASTENLVLDGNGAIINGSVTIEGDYYELKNLTIKGDLHITGKVQNSFISEKLTVEGNTRIAEDNVATASSFKAAAEESTKTKITIIFKDSTMATIEIAKEDIYLSSHGTTSVKSISLRANANIFADEDIIIPKIDIVDGVTEVELNVTVKDIIIESNDDIKVSGKGNIENLTVNTDKKVTLDTQGTISKLETTNTQSVINIGTNVTVNDVVVPEGNSAEDTIENFEEVKDNIEKVDGETNPDYVAPAPSAPGAGGSTDGFFDAGILESEENEGFVKLNIKNQGNYTVKYYMVPRSTSGVPQKGQQAPAEAIEYQIGDEFVLWAGHELYVYQVDQSNKIIDMVDVNETFHHWYFDHQFNDDDTVTFTVNNKIGNRTVDALVDPIYFLNEDSLTKMTDFSGVSWQTDEQSLPNFTVPVPAGFNQSKFIIIFNISDEEAHSGYTTWASSHHNYSDATTESLYVSALKQLAIANEADEFHSFIGMLSHTLESSTSQALPLQDYSFTKEGYMTQLQTQEITTFAALRETLTSVNTQYAASITKLEEATRAVEGLFKENQYNYEPVNRLAEGVGQDQIDAAKALVAKLSAEVSEKQNLLDDIANAERYLSLAAYENIADSVDSLVDLPVETEIGTLLNSYLMPEGVNVSDIKINVVGIGETINSEYDFVEDGTNNYLGINEAGELILNRLNMTEQPITEFVDIRLQDVNGNQLDSKIVEFKIPVSGISSDKSSNALIKANSAEPIEVIRLHTANSSIKLNKNATVEELKASLVANDGSVQSHVVKSAAGEVKTTGELVHGDKLIVTAENAQTIRVYDIIIPIFVTEVQKLDLGTFIAKIPYDSVDEVREYVEVLKRTSDTGRSSTNFSVEETTVAGEYKFTIQDAAEGVSYEIDSNMSLMLDGTGRPVSIQDNVVIWEPSITGASATQFTTSQVSEESEVQIPDENTTSAEGTEETLQYTTEESVEWATEINK